MLQEFVNGAELYVGGFESCDLVCSGGNPLGVTHLVDCRGGYALDRAKRHHIYEVPAGVASVPVGFTRIASMIPRDQAQRLLQPLVDVVRRGRCRVLIFCVNGRHRSSQLCAMLLAGARRNTPHTALQGSLAAVAGALNHVWRARSLAEWTSLPGQSGFGFGLDAFAPEHVMLQGSRLQAKRPRVAGTGGGDDAGCRMIEEGCGKTHRLA